MRVQLAARYTESRVHFSPAEISEVTSQVQSSSFGAGKETSKRDLSHSWSSAKMEDYLKTPKNQTYHAELREKIPF